MEQLPIYKIGFDPLPVEGSKIILFTRESSGDCFSSIHASEAVVSSIGHGPLSTKPDPEWCDTEDTYLGTYMAVYEERLLVDGDLWSYTHEHHNVLGGCNVFPFQNRECFDVAVAQGWVTVQSESTVMGKTKEEATFDVRSATGLVFETEELHREENLIYYMQQHSTSMSVVVEGTGKLWDIRWQGVSLPCDYFSYV